MGVEPVKDQHLDQMTELVNEVVSQDDEIATTLHNLDQQKGHNHFHTLSQRHQFVRH